MNLTLIARAFDNLCIHRGHVKEFHSLGHRACAVAALVCEMGNIDNAVIRGALLYDIQEVYPEVTWSQACTKYNGVMASRTEDAYKHVAYLERQELDCPGPNVPVHVFRKYTKLPERTRIHEYFRTAFSGSSLLDGVPLSFKWSDLC